MTINAKKPETTDGMPGEQFDGGLEPFRMRGLDNARRKWPPSASGTEKSRRRAWP